MTFIWLFLLPVGMLAFVALVVILCVIDGRRRWPVICSFLGVLLGVSGAVVAVNVGKLVTEKSADRAAARTHRAEDDSSARKLAAERGGKGGKRFEELNFTLTGLDDWTELEPAAFGSTASYLARRKGASGEMLTVVVEHSATGLTSGGLTQLIRSYAEGSGELVDWKMLEPLELAGLPALCTVYVVRANGVRSTSVNVHHVENGYARQFVLTTTRAVSTVSLRRDLERLIRSFSLIDPGRPGGTAKMLAAGGEFPEWGFRMAAGGPGWAAVEGDDGVSGQVWNGSLHGTGYLMVLPMILPDMEMDAPALLRGLVSGTTRRAISANGVTSRPLELPGAEAVEYVYQENVQDAGDYQRIVRIIRRGSMAWLVDAGAPVGEERRLAEIRAAVDGFQLLPPPGRMARVAEDVRALVLNQAGLSYYIRGQYDHALPLFEEAVGADPQDRDYLANVLDSLSNLGMPDQLLERLEKAPASLKDQPVMRCRAASALAALGRAEEAKDLYGRIFAGGFRDDDYLSEAAEFLMSNGAEADALALVDAYRKAGTSRKLDLLQYRLFSRAGRKEEALSIIQRLHETAPGNQDILVDYAAALGEADRKKEALEVIRKAVEQDPEDPRLLYNLGFHLADSELFEEAAEVLEKAAALSPKDESIAGELGYVRSRLGRGHDSEIRIPLAPVPLPPSMAASPPWDPASADPDADRIFLRHATALGFKPRTPQERTLYGDIAVLSPRAVESLSTMRFPFKPLAERIYVNRLEVLDEEGNVIAKAEEKSHYVTSEDDGEADGGKLLCIPVPGLTPGGRLRYEVTYRDRSPSGAFSFDSWFFRSRYDSREMVVCLKAADADVLAKTTGGVQESREGEHRVWRVRDLPSIPSEGARPLAELMSPVLYLGPPGTDWKKLGDSYLRDISAQLAADPDVESLARDITAKATDDAAKIRLLFRWVQKEFTYKAIEFGTRARIPHPAALTCSNRYGDCKDLSVVLHAMLRAVGVESRLCLVHTGNRLEPGLPSLDQFNHMIVHLPAAPGREATWLDPTDTHHAWVMRVSSWLEGRGTLVLENDASRIVTVPSVPAAGSSRVSTARHLAKSESGTLEISELLRVDGSAADSFRGYFVSIPAAERLQKFRELISEIDPRVTLEQMEIRHLQDQDQPLEIDMKLTGADFLTEDGTLKRLPVIWERDYLRPMPYARRITPFAIAEGWEVASKITSALPLPAQAGAKTHGRTDAAWGEWKITGGKEADGWSIAFDGRLRRAEIVEASRYADYSGFWENGLGTLAEPWR